MANYYAKPSRLGRPKDPVGGEQNVARAILQATRLPLQLLQFMHRKLCRRATVFAESVCSPFEKTMRINNSVSGFAWRQTIEQCHEARLIRIAHGRFAIWLDPFRMLNPKVVVDLLPELHVSVDLMMQRRWLGERFTCGAG